MFYIYKKQEKIVTFIYVYKNPDTLRRVGQYALPFIQKKARHFILRYSLWKLRNRHIYIYKKAWHFELCDVFIYKNSETSKKQDNLRYVFLFTKSLTLCVTQFFVGFLKLAEGGGGVINKNNAPCVKFLYARNISVYIPFLYTKSLTLCRSM